jgi:biopolymer transport protein ExbD
MSRRKHRRRSQGDVELNLAAMLDMAFQLLTFFILTFKPAPVEGQISLKLPPPVPVTNASTQAAGADISNVDPTTGLNSLVISVFPAANGSIGSLALGEGNVANLGQLETRLRAVLGDPSSPFDQVIIQVGSALRYEELMNVIDVCTRQTLPDGHKLSKLSFVELPSGQGAGN